MYCIRLIKKSVSETDKNGKIIYDDFVTATHLKITEGKIYFYDPVSSNQDNQHYMLNSYSYIFINHYLKYTINELQEAYKNIIQAYSTLSQSSSYHRDFDNVISIFELLDTMFAIKEKKIIDEITQNNKSKINSLLHNKSKNESSTKRKGKSKEKENTKSDEAAENKNRDDVDDVKDSIESGENENA